MPDFQWRRGGNASSAVCDVENRRLLVCSNNAGGFLSFIDGTLIGSPTHNIEDAMAAAEAAFRSEQKPTGSDAKGRPRGLR